MKYIDLANRDTYGTILGYVSLSYLKDILKTNGALCRCALIHYPFKFNNPDLLYDFNIDHYELLLHNVNIDKTMIFLNSCKRGVTEIVSLLLSSNTVNHNSDNGYALVKSVEYGNLSILKILMKSEKIRDTQEIRKEMMRWAFWMKRVEIIDYLIGELPSEVSVNTLSLACEYGYIHIVRYLTLKGVRDEDGRCFMKSVKKGYVKIVKYLLMTNKENLTNKVREALYITSEGKGVDIFKILSDIDGKFDRDIVFKKACRYGNVDIVNFLLKNGWEPKETYEKEQGILLAERRGYDNIINNIRSKIYPTSRCIS